MSVELRSLQSNDGGFRKVYEEGRVRGSVSLRGGRIFTLAYADDVVLLAEEEERIRRMLRRLEKYLREKR